MYIKDNISKAEIKLALNKIFEFNLLLRDY